MQLAPATTAITFTCDHAPLPPGAHNSHTSLTQINEVPGQWRPQWEVVEVRALLVFIPAMPRWDWWDWTCAGRVLPASARTRTLPAHIRLQHCLRALCCPLWNSHLYRLADM
jgi:hypothetical protein